MSNYDDMDVALCIAGQMRTYEKCYKYQKKNIIDVFEPDIFIHTEEETGITRKTDETNIEKKRNEVVTAKRLNELYDPTLYEIISPFTQEERKEFKGIKLPQELIEEDPVQSAGNIPEFYGVKQCNNLKNRWEDERGYDYELVIRMRPDLMIKDKIPDKVIENPNILWHTYPPGDSVSNKLAISNSENMDYYSSVWDKLPEYWENPLANGNPHKYRVGERLMKHHMEISSIETDWFDIDSKILRKREVLANRADNESLLTVNNLKSAIHNPRIAVEYLAGYVENRLGKFR